MDAQTALEVVTADETEEDHLKRHPHARAAKCARCCWIRNRAKWKKSFSFCHPCSQEQVTWLGESETRFGVGCVICRGAKKKNPFASFLVRDFSMMVANAWAKHEKGKTHQDAHRAWVKRASHAGLPTAEATATSGGKLSVMHVRAMLVEVKRAGSAADFSTSVENVRAGAGSVAPGNDSKICFRNLVSCGSCLEMRKTRQMMSQASFLALAHDARDHAHARPLQPQRGGAVGVSARAVRGF